MSTNKLASPHGERQVLATEVMKPGRLYQVGTVVAFVAGIQEHAIADLVTIDTVGTFRWDIANTAVVALDADVYYDPTDNTMYAATASGRFVAGKCNKAKASGDGTEILVEINRQ